MAFTEASAEFSLPCFLMCRSWGTASVMRMSMTDMTMRSSMRVKPASWCWRFMVFLMGVMFPRRSCFFSIKTLSVVGFGGQCHPTRGVCERLDTVLSESIINAMAQSLAFLLVHVIFSTKDREPFLDVAVRPELYAYLGAVFRNAKCECYRIGGVADHVHLAVRLSRTVTAAEL